MLGLATRRVSIAHRGQGRVFWGKTSRAISKTRFHTSTPAPQSKRWFVRSAIHVIDIKVIIPITADGIINRFVWNVVNPWERSCNVR
jgi:hypothetical protein